MKLYCKLIFFLIIILLQGNAYSDSSMKKGDISFNGQVISPPCNVSFSSLDQEIDLGPIFVNLFHNIGDRSPKKKIKLKFNDCVFSSNNSDGKINIRIMFISEPTGSTDRSLFGGKTILKGYGVRLIDKDENIIPNGQYINFLDYFDDKQEIVLYSMLESYLPKSYLSVGNIKTQLMLSITYL